MSQDNENEGCCLLPDWAERKSDGNYMEAGAQLATRDGRRCGNAYVDRVEAHDRLGHVAVVITDMGNTFHMTVRELEGAFHPPVYVMKLEDARKHRGMNEKKLFAEWWDQIGSGIVKLKTEDSEEHTHRVAKAAWLFLQDGNDTPE